MLPIFHAIIASTDSGADFSPSNIAGLKLWLIGDNAPAGAIATWTDNSGDGNDVTQSTEGKKPAKVASVINGRAVVRFDGTDDCLRKVSSTLPAGNAAWTGFIVYSRTGDAEAFGWGANTQTNNRVGFYSVSDVAYTEYSNSSNSGGSLAVSSPTLFAARYDGTDLSTGVQHWIKGLAASMSSDASGANVIPSTPPIAVGAIPTAEAAFFNGDIAEILVYDTALSAGNRQAVEDYLGAKYGITITH